MNLGFGELVVIFGIILLLFGARRLPEIGRSLGEAIKAFQDSMRGKPKERENDRTPDSGERRE